MRRSLAGLLLVLTLPSPAAAGGALWELNQEFYLPGDVVRAESGVWLESGMGRLEDGPFHAYLSEVGKRMPPPLPPDALRVAPVVVEPLRGTEHGDASVEFELPSVPPGRYYLSTCNDPCKLPLGDIMATELIVAASEADGQVAVLAGRFSARVRTLRILLFNRVLGHRAESLQGRVAALEREFVALSEEVADLRAAAARREARPEPDSSSSLAPLLAFVIPAALLGVVLGRRHKSSV